VVARERKFIIRQLPIGGKDDYDRRREAEGQGQCWCTTWEEELVRQKY